jgi:tetratricopeptide (TPR) repeat protein
MDRSEEAFAEIARARELDPPMPLLAAWAVGIHAWGGRPERCRAELEKAVELAPGFGLAYFHMGAAELALGRLAEAAATLERARALGIGPGWAESLLALVDAARGEHELGRERMRALEARRESTFLSATALALGFATLGERERALDELERAFEERDTLLPCLRRFAPWLAPLENEPRYRAIVRRMDFPAASRADPEAPTLSLEPKR